MNRKFISFSAGLYQDMAQDELIERAREAHRLGELALAEELYGQVLARDPDDPDASHLLGVIRYQRGEYPAALELIGKADRLRPAHPATLNNLGSVLRDLGRYEEALSALTRALALRPDFAEALTNLGMVYRKLGRRDEAEFAYRQALALNPRDSKALNNLGNLCQDQGEFGAALDWYGKALALEPNSSLSQYNLGCVLLKMGRLDEAEAALAQAVKVDPVMLDAQYALSSLYQLRFEFPRAIEILQRAISLQPERAEGHIKLAETYFAMNQFRESLRSLRQAEALVPASSKVLLLYSRVLQSQGKSVEAQQSLDRVLAQEPENREALRIQANLFMDQGLFAKSAAVVRGMLRRDNGDSSAWHLLARVVAGKEKDSLTREIERALNNRNTTLLQRLELQFALGGLLEDLGEYDRAFASLSEANRLKRGTFRFSLEPRERKISRIREVYDAEAMRRFAGRGWRSQVPVFIVGMPRSGTTLAEQILSSHPEVHGGGELRLLSETVAEHLQIQPLDESLSPEIVLRARDLPELGRRYVEELRKYAPAARHIIDKMPGNYLFLGLIALILPEAKIIHCVRGPMDTCWSLFKKLFTHGHQYAYDLEELAHYYLLYQRMMRHWQGVLPGPILELRYEDLVVDQEGQTRRLLEFCGLAWHPGCLHFERNKRPVHTASSVQVRQPLHNRSVGLWKRYAQGLQPLRELLQPCQDAYLAEHHVAGIDGI
jgi:tetratricopeptide (TPR) repeat protein